MRWTDLQLGYTKIDKDFKRQHSLFLAQFFMETSFSCHIKTNNLHVLAHTQAFILCGLQSAGCLLEQLIVLSATTSYYQ